MRSKINKVLFLTLADKSSKFLIELVINVLILKKFGLLNFGLYSTVLAYSNILSAVIFLGGRELQLNYLQSNSKKLIQSLNEILTFRFSMFLFFYLVISVNLRFNLKELFFLFIIIAFNSLNIIYIIFENFAAINNKLAIFKNYLLKANLIIFIVQILVLNFDIISFNQYIYIYIFKFIFIFSFLKIKNGINFLKYSNPIDFIKKILNVKYFIGFQFLVGIYSRVGLIVGSYLLDEYSLGQLGFSFTLFFIISQIFQSFIISREEKYFSVSNNKFSQYDKNFINDIYIFTIVTAFLLVVFFNLLYLIPQVNQFVYLQKSFTILLLSIPFLVFNSLRKIVLIKKNEETETKIAFIKIFSSYILFITCSFVFFKIQISNPIEFAYLSSLIYFFAISKNLIFSE